MSISPSHIGDEQAPVLLATDIAARVMAARVAVGYSIEELAVTCGLTSAEIGGIESGKDHSPEKLRRIANALRVPASEFLSGEI